MVLAHYDHNALACFSHELRRKRISKERRVLVGGDISGDFLGRGVVANGRGLRPRHSSLHDDSPHQ